jgi:acyl dehydratase
VTEAKTVQVPEFQTARITDEALEKARSLIGVWLRRDVHWPHIAEPLSQHDVRRWAVYSVGDDNPLWCDGEYAKGTVWGRTIAPPTFLYTIDTTIVAPGFPGVQWIHGSSRWEHYRPVGVGDRITARARVIDMKEKTGRHAPRFVIQTGEVLYANQHDELVSRCETDILRVPRGKSGEGFRFTDQGANGQGVTRYSAEEIDEIRQAYVNEERRGAEPRYWEDVDEGDELPPVAKGPLTLVDIMAFYAGRRSVYNPLKLAFLERERHPRNVYVSPQTGVPVHPAAGHFDVEIAHEVGMPGAYDQGWMRTNWVGHLVTNWMGDMGFVRRLDVRLGLPNIVGDLTWCRGRVRGKSTEGSDHLVTIECWGENQKGVRTVEGTAVVKLPSRDVADTRWF